MDAEVVRQVGRVFERWVRVLPEGNSVMSGLGLWPLVAMLATAADEPGRGELERAAGVPAERGAGLATELVERIRTGSTDLHAALGVWVHERLKLSEGFDSVVPAPLIGQLTGDGAKDKAKLDAWASDNTHGLIKKMPITITPDLALVLASAIALKTTWVRPFDEGQRRLREGPWAGVDCTWLTRTDRDLDSVRLYDDLTVVTVQGEGDVDVLLGLGETRAERGDVLSTLLSAAADPDRGEPGEDLLEGKRFWQREAKTGDEVAPGVTVATSTAWKPDVFLSLPAFEVEMEHDLLQHAGIFGLQTVSRPTEQGHFSAISPTPLFVGEAKQTVLARFFATGFEAAAVTAIGLRAAGMALERAKRLVVTFDRPFGFVAVQRDTRLPIVAGWIDRP